jgi:hypothetical protein
VKTRSTVRTLQKPLLKKSSTSSPTQNWLANFRRAA